jgi:tetratricopeptide (TPR) repeat protein
MATDAKIVKGYTKTVNTIWMVIIALIAGFSGGIVYSAYRNSALLAASSSQATDSAPLSSQQQETLKTYLQRTKANPKDTEAWTNLGHLYFDSGQYDLAVSAYEQSLALDSQRPDIWTDLGVMYRRSGRPEKAAASFDRAIAINPQHHIALFNKGVVMMHDLKDPQGALNAWERLIKIDPQAKTPSGQSIKELIDELKKNKAS